VERKFLSGCRVKEGDLMIRLEGGRAGKEYEEVLMDNFDGFGRDRFCISLHSVHLFYLAALIVYPFFYTLSGTTCCSLFSVGMPDTALDIACHFSYINSFPLFLSTPCQRLL